MYLSAGMGISQKPVFMRFSAIYEESTILVAGLYDKSMEQATPITFYWNPFTYYSIS